MPELCHGGLLGTRSTALPWAHLRCLGLGYALGIACNRTVPTNLGQRRMDAMTALVPVDAWYRYSAGDRSKGWRWHSWALVDVRTEPDRPDLRSGFDTVLVRRNDTTGELAWYRCWFPRLVSQLEFVSVAGHRWKDEENFQSAKAPAWSVSTSTKPAAGTRGTAGPTCPCSPTHS
jgi:hypothetical protein